ncbi:MAG: mechanosensitive ion channel, partial [Candidatus Cloacimonetes bacterium]|nr:mechanosensitive ion channel [Candidatus Cloacimonadota bacterium]
MEELLKKLVEWVSLFGLRLIAALAILVIGLFIAKLLRKLIDRMMNRKKVDPTISTFVSSLTYTLLVVFIILAALSKLGVQTTSFIAVIGAAGLAIGLALQGSLSNFAAGFLMLILRPFKVGDYIKAGGVSGTVNKISIFT